MWSSSLSTPAAAASIACFMTRRRKYRRATAASVKCGFGRNPAVPSLECNRGESLAFWHDLEIQNEIQIPLERNDGFCGRVLVTAWSGKLNT